MSQTRGVRILNGHGGSWTSRPRALTLVKSGRARYVDEHTIEFIETDRRHIAVGRGLEAARRKVFIDGGMATLAAIAGLPVIHPIELITLRTKRKKSP